MTDLHRQLREAAASHRPDRARMLARVRRAEARQTRSWPRVVLASAATAGALLAAGYAVAPVVQDPPPRQSVATGPSRPSGPLGPEGPARLPGPARTEDGPLWADGSVDPHSNAYWAQSNVTLKARRPLTTLTVELRIALTDAVRDTGNWQSPPARDFTVSVSEREGALIYRWTLKAGRSLPAGEHVFAGQYDHAPGGRDANDDWYTAAAMTADESFAVRGDFAPAARPTP